MKYDAPQEVEPWSPFVRSLEKLSLSTNDGRGWHMKTRLLCFCFGKEKRLMGGRHFVDIIGDISWTKGVSSRGHFWRHLVDKSIMRCPLFG